MDYVLDTVMPWVLWFAVVWMIHKTVTWKENKWRRVAAKRDREFERERHQQRRDEWEYQQRKREWASQQQKQGA
jgi:hypothetical protein